MTRRHGWNGSPPADESEARARILDAAIRCIDRDGPDQFSLSRVAAELGVIRATVYRYYPSADELLTAVSSAFVESFLEEMRRRLKPFTRPADWAVELLAIAIEEVPSAQYLILLLSADRPMTFTQGVVSEEAMLVGMEVARSSSVDWDAAGYDDQRMSELMEVILRIIQSMVVTPPTPPRTGAELRGFLRRWLAPAIAARP